MKAGEVMWCAGCRKHPLTGGGPRTVHFYVLEIDQAIVDPAAARGVVGTAMSLGGGHGHPLEQVYALGEVLAPDPEVIKTLGGHDAKAITRLHVCAKCYVTKTLAELEPRPLVTRSVDEEPEEVAP